jgi:putative ABC transport system ATP-binding protein
MSSFLFKIKNVSFSYPDGKPVFEEIAFDIKKGALIIIRGESGQGKSTFLKLFNRFNDLTDGKILYHQKDLRDYHISEVRRSILYLPQLPHIIEGSVEDNLSFPFSFHVHKDKQYSPGKAKKWLDYFHLGVSLSNEASKLSVGQKQRIALIRALLLEPEVLLLDEPCSSLDSRNRGLIEQKIESLLQSAGVTVIMATHSEVGFSEAACRFFLLANRELTEKT